MKFTCIANVPLPTVTLVMQVNRANFELIISLLLLRLANMVQILLELWAEIMQLAAKML